MSHCYSATPAVSLNLNNRAFELSSFGEDGESGCWRQLGPKPVLASSGLGQCCTGSLGSVEAMSQTTGSTAVPARAVTAALWVYGTLCSGTNDSWIESWWLSMLTQGIPRRIHVWPDLFAGIWLRYPPQQVRQKSSESLRPSPLFQYSGREAGL